jgi:hypothetical protein
MALEASMPVRQLPGATLVARTTGQSQDRAIYLLWAVFWVFLTVGEIQDHYYNQYVRWWEPLLWQASSALPTTLWLIAQRRQQRYAKYLEQPLLWFVHHLKWLPLACVSSICFMYLTRHSVYALVDRQYNHEPWLFVAVYETLRLVLFVSMWLGVTFAFSSFEQWSLERQRLAQLQRSFAEAQLSQLKSQLRPHFLFNALNTISSLMHSDVGRADHLLAQMSELLRSTLQLDDQQLSSLQEELHVLGLYAQIMQERFSDRVVLRWSIEPGIGDAQVPALLLQPLLENAFKHGVEKSREPVQVEIAAYTSDGLLHLVVRNTGTLHDTATGVGLRNSRERLRLLFGEAAQLQLRQTNDWVSAQVTMPLQSAAV